MKSIIAISFAAAAAALPQASSSSDCASTVDGTFEISTVNVTDSASKRSIEKRQASGDLTLTLNDGVLKDQDGRQGYIASNYQFQFDSPIQAGALETDGFSLCSNDSLALMGSTIFYQCLSGDFYNLYSQSTGAQCIPIHIQAVMQAAASTGVSQISDGQPQATSAGAVVTQISDGQPQASSAAPVVTQISDGQPQASAPASMPVVTQISDGQIQASAPASVAVVTQISDGQIQASAPASVAVVTQISDGQIQASAPASVAVITQISDGQPQASAPGSAISVVTQISDGQPQAPVATSNSTANYTANATQSAMPEYTGAAATGAASIGALAAGLFGLFALL